LIKEVTTKSPTIAQKEIVRTIKGEVIEINHDNKSIVIKEYLDSRGLMFDSTVFDRVALYFNNNTEFQGGYYFQKYEQIQHGQPIEAKYKKNKVGENIVIEIKRRKDLE